MRISEILEQGKATLSFEVFPPKTKDNYDTIKEVTGQIAGLRPAFMSVTYGAGGGTSESTIDIAKNLKEKYQVAVLSHLTCASSTEEEIEKQLSRLQEIKIENILALRGDIPSGAAFPKENGFRYACELIRKIKKYGDFCVGGACYPEGHIEAASREEDLIHLKEKVEAGCDFLTTQMFFDNDVFYQFLSRIREKGIKVPVIAGIMPVISKKQIEKSVSLSGTCLPARFCAMVARFSDNTEAMKQAGIAYATEQAADLISHGIKAIHIYTMNRPDVARCIQNNLSDLLKETNDRYFLERIKKNSLVSSGRELYNK